ncbi:MAG TPA: right-handed parallel beta-helix repeat-containing protein [Candidatus Acidoferrum sp.]|nr:right-handed parallel beta-helix repeat-containing protein [Candidatus Acidoferrum sp.]
MFRKPVSIIILSLLVLSALALAFYVRPVKSDYVWTQTIYINANGSINPPTAPISTIDNITYTSTDNIVNVTGSAPAVIIQRNNIIFDGAGHTLQGTQVYISTGIEMYGISNVTIKNVKIAGFYYGIWLNSSSDNSVTGNNITESNGYGVWLYPSSNNDSISGNNITANNGEGIEIYYSSNNSVSGNTITNNWDGVDLGSSTYISISGNTIAANNQTGVDLGMSSYISVSGNNITANNKYGLFIGSYCNNTTIYHNNLISNIIQAYTGSTIVWDDGYPSGGNYWSDYNGTDLFSGANQNVTGSDGIGDISYFIGANNTDHYPLMGEFGSSTPAGSNVTVFPSDNVGLIFQNVTYAGWTTASGIVSFPVALSNLTGGYFDVIVGARFSGSVTVRIIFDGSNMTLNQKSRLQLMQFTLPGDITGSTLGVPDGRVDIRDISYVAKQFGTSTSSPNWNPIADLTGPSGVPDGRVDIRDISYVARRFGTSGNSTNWINITTYVDTTSNVIYGITTHFSIIGIHQS